MKRLREKASAAISWATQSTVRESEIGRSRLLGWVTWYWFFVGTVLLVVGMRYPSVAGIPDGLNATLFHFALSAGHWYSLTFLVTILLFYPLVLLLPVRRIVVATAVALCVVIILLVVADTFVFSLFRFHLNGMVFSLLLSDAGSEIFVFDSSVYLTAVCILLATIAVALFLVRMSWGVSQRRNNLWFGPVLGMLLVTVFIVENFWFAWADAAGDVAITSQARIYPLYTPTRAADFFVSNGLVEKNKRRKSVGINSGAVNYPRQPLVCKSTAKLPDIFLIVVDSWRHDEINTNVTPNMHAFARNSLNFTHHYSGGNNTRTGLFSLFYGLPATYWESFLDARVGSVFVGQLLKQKYDMAIYASAKLTGPEFDRTIFSEVPDLRKRTMADGVYDRDVLSTSEFIRHLEGSDIRKPTFGFLFYDAPHSNAYDSEFDGYFEPAAKSVNYFELGKNTDPEPYVNLYRKSIKSTDKQVGRALAAIQTSGRWDDAIIIITADHGQEFNDNGLGYWGHNGNFTDAQIRVPLLVKWPGKENKFYDRITTHYDIVTTLLQDVFSCSNSMDDYSVGTSLFAEEQRDGFVVGGFGDFAVRLQDRIYWVDKYGGIHVLSDDNHELNEEPQAKVLAKALENTSRFYK